MKPSKLFRMRNARRLELIGKKYAGGLDEGEEAELAGLKKWVGDYMAEKCPRDRYVIDDMKRRLEALKRKLAAKKAGDSAGPA